MYKNKKKSIVEQIDFILGEDIVVGDVGTTTNDVEKFVPGKVKLDKRKKCKKEKKD